MTLTSKRAAGGEIAAGKDLIEWTPEGKLNYSRGAGEDTPLKNRHMLVCERDCDSSCSKQGGTARDFDLTTLVPAKDLSGTGVFLMHKESETKH